MALQGEPYNFRRGDITLGGLSEEEYVAHGHSHGLLHSLITVCHVKLTISTNRQAQIRKKAIVDAGRIFPHGTAPCPTNFPTNGLPNSVAPMRIMETFSAYEPLAGVEEEPFERAVEKPARCSPPLPGIAFSEFGVYQATAAASEQETDVIYANTFGDASERG
jgi:hypothetical protein